ncbi:MAG TPA: nickel-responsive transcriptional regulator NikR [Paracoccus sp. (in: a-proteobacteria)]|uniref:nickel-responsive transcriptional regulator NikR n=1 Tax=Paracoccus sp. TaxID=267 RepID=UPI002C601F82|nr:nickel-responsive transcriptional regulator NikR [Paracoccus sp. (in: a-proteobacteria)]HWL59029.1 nickel-responsive transcriptional regulator NikR [Paracoccus sp. (in: a-proteobacteria)]
MIRTTITMDAGLTSELDAYIERTGASSRSEAIRDLVRRGLNTVPEEHEDSSCVGVISYTIDQTMPGLAKMLRMSRLDRHDELIFSASVPVDHRYTIDFAVMKGTFRQVNDFAQALFLERGIRHGAVALTPVEAALQHHDHGDGQPRTHVHMHVQESF